MEREKHLKQKKRSTLESFLLIIFVSLLLISSFKIVKYWIENRNTNKQLDMISDVITIEEDSEDVEIIEQEEEIDKFNPYWDYIKMKLIDVDFTQLKETNRDVKGWIQVNGTNINYPFVQTGDNSHYLTHSFDNSYNSAGWIFLDYRNSLLTSDKNTILYGHGRVSQVMFSSLRNILTSGWLKNTSNYVVKLSTESENTLWQVFSVYHIPTTSDYIQTDFNSDDEYVTFTNMLIDRSAYDFQTSISPNDRILTLSTCYNFNGEKVVLHAKLIKREGK